MDSITVNGTEYVPANQDTDDLGVRIIVLQRGWVVVGHARRHGPRIRVTNCAVVRYWGTTAGLGELATKGPLDKTKLDNCPPVESMESEVVLSMEVGSDVFRDRE